MKTIFALGFVFVLAGPLLGQNLRVDSRLRPILDDFLNYCKVYQIDFEEKLLALERIDIVDDLDDSSSATTLGMLQRNTQGEVKTIAISPIAQIDPEILKVITFHELGHYFLEYRKHVCHDCGEIMAVINSSYFDVVRDWDNQVKILFERSPAYQRRLEVATTSIDD